ncbi:hypothetical protein CGC20_36090 [Leishmania donovani]|uniref:Uncharacterized protein n=1 Tax=Leishmania donovani TaxID=5661 RepID=A0A504XVG3_LEIDO|nr:hypothetical protein CGC20_36090 [Leishmania donovani]
MLSCSSNDADLFCFPHRNGDAAPTSPPSQPPLTQERLLALQQSASDRNLVALAPATTTALNTSERRTGTTVLGATHLGGDTDQVIRQRQERVMSWLAGSSTTPNPPLDNADDGAIDAALRGSGVPDGCTERASATDKVAGEQPQLQRRVLHAPSLVTTPVESVGATHVRRTGGTGNCVRLADSFHRSRLAEAYANASGLGAVAFPDFSDTAAAEAVTAASAPRATSSHGDGEDPTALRVCTLSGRTLRVTADRRSSVAVLAQRVVQYLKLRGAQVQLKYAQTGLVFDAGTSDISGVETSSATANMRLCDLPEFQSSDVFIVLLRAQRGEPSPLALLPPRLSAAGWLAGRSPSPRPSSAPFPVRLSRRLQCACLAVMPPQRNAHAKARWRRRCRPSPSQSHRPLWSVGIELVVYVALLLCRR